MEEQNGRPDVGEDPRDREAGRGVGAAPVVVHVHDGFVARDFGAGAVLRPRECYAVPTRYSLRVLNVVRFSRTLDFLCLALNATLRSTTDRYLLFPPSVASRRVASQANRLADSTLLTTQLMEIFNSVLFADDKEGVFVRAAIRRDIEAVNERDPACESYVHALLYLKGFHALEAHRIQHTLWNRGQKLLALTLQARISTVFALDLHPAARLGKGILIDHGTGVVIGETAVVGDNVSILQGVTLGGTGKEAGDRHPKARDSIRFLTPRASLPVALCRSPTKQRPRHQITNQ